MDIDYKPEITVFHCINSFNEDDSRLLADEGVADLTFVKMACSSMVKDVFLLRAFEAGADAVVVLVCPEGHCRYVEGNLRANKRVAWVRGLLDEIGLDGRRLALFNVSGKDQDLADQAIQKTLAALKDLGPSPAK